MREVLRGGIRPAWLVGEIQRLRRSRNGHLYFELVEKGRRDDVVAKLEAVVWRSDLEEIEAALSASGQELAEGLEIRCLGHPDFYPPFGRLQVVVRSIDSEFTLGLMAKRRRETLATLEREGLLGRNAELPFPDLPLRVGLVTSDGSAAYHDFVTTLAESGYAFEVVVAHSAVQGSSAERELVGAIRSLAKRALDCLVVVRGGGARADLAAFDSRGVSTAIALCQLPVVTGLGHEIDDTVADAVAHTRAKTPTRAAEMLVERVRTAERLLDAGRSRLVAATSEPLFGARETLARLGHGLERASATVDRAARRLERVQRGLVERAGARSRSARRRRERLALELRGAALAMIASRGPVAGRLVTTIGERIGHRLGLAGERLEGMSRLCVELAPARTLRRGFSVTRSDGRLVRSPADVEPGARLETELARGTISSRVEAEGDL